MTNIYGFGTHRLKDEVCIDAVTTALKAGYNLIDTAEKYYNGKEIGIAIKKSKRSRESFMLVHKLTDVLEFSRTKEETFVKVYGYLNELGVDYIDILLMHGPSPRYHPFPENFKAGNILVWRAMNEMKRVDRIKATGVSNFNKEQIMYLIEATGCIPDYIEVEFNVINSEKMYNELIRWCQNMGIKVIAYSPIVAGATDAIISSDEYQNYVKDNPETTPAEYALRFCLTYDTIPIPRSSNPEHILNNLNYLKKGKL